MYKYTYKSMTVSIVHRQNSLQSIQGTHRYDIKPIIEKIYQQQMGSMNLLKTRYMSLTSRMVYINVWIANTYVTNMKLVRNN